MTTEQREHIINGLAPKAVKLFAAFGLTEALARETLEGQSDDTLAMLALSPAGLIKIFRQLI